MLREITPEEFARGVKNPHFHKLMVKIEVPVRKEDYATFKEWADFQGVPVEIIMRNGLAHWAEELREPD